MNKRAAGAAYEQKAADYLEERGCRILERNFRCRAGEIDLIAEDQGYLVFVEVKYRSDARAGYGGEAVDERKQKRIIRAAQWYLQKMQIPPEHPCRFDVITFLSEEVTWIRDAFWCC